MEEVRNLATRLRKRLDQLNVLVNIAGLVLGRRTATSDGLKQTWLSTTWPERPGWPTPARCSAALAYALLAPIHHQRQLPDVRLMLGPDLGDALAPGRCGSGTIPATRRLILASTTLAMSRAPARSRSLIAVVNTSPGSSPASSADRNVRHSHLAW